MLNYFNGDGAGGGFPTSRGATTLEEFKRQQTKIITALLSIDAEIVGLMEIENDGYGQTSAISGLVTGLNAIAGSGVYTYVNPGTAVWGSDEIAVALIYKPGSVAPVGVTATLTTGTFSQEEGSRLNRQPLAQSFQEKSSGEVLTVMVNHLKSKGSCPTAPDLNADQNDGQSCWNAHRTQSAAALLAWIATDPTGSGDPDVLIIGDLNSYAMEDPITTLTAGGFTNLAKAHGESYSYGFDGQWGTLDYALASASLARQITDATIWHSNADEPRILDYNQEFNPPSLYRPDAYRAADHDAVVTELNLYTSGARLGIHKTVVLTHDPARPGDPITYTIVISNSGDVTATNVRITDTMPMGVNGSNLDITITIGAGTRFSMTVPARVDDARAPGHGDRQYRCLWLRRGPRQR